MLSAPFLLVNSGCCLVSVHKWPIFLRAAFSADFDPQRSHATLAVETLVRPCPEKKLLIYESGTCTGAHDFCKDCGWTLSKMQIGGGFE
jgi:hypothetical protein